MRTSAAAGGGAGADRLAEQMPDAAHAVGLGDFNCMTGEPIHASLAELGFVNAMEAAGGGIRPTHDTTGAVAYPSTTSTSARLWLPA